MAYILQRWECDSQREFLVSEQRSEVLILQLALGNLTTAARRRHTQPVKEILYLEEGVDIVCAGNWLRFMG